MVVTERRLTLAEFLALRERKPALEYVDGEVTQKPYAGGQHSVLQMEVTRLVNEFARPHRLAMALLELQTTFAGCSVTPDVAVYRWGRIPQDANGEIADDFLDPPDMVAEIASPGQSANFLVRRCLWYVTHGVTAVLLVDPDDDSVVVFRPGTLPVAVRPGGVIDLSNVVPGLEIDVQGLFDSLRIC